MSDDLRDDVRGILAHPEAEAFPVGLGDPPRALTGLRRIRQVCRQILGMPDFDHYRAHMQLRHPGAPLLSEREFHAVAIDRRYGSGGPRCC